MELKGKKVVLTGGTAGIGKATAALLVAEGAEVLITGRDAAKLETVCEELACRGRAFDIGELEELTGHGKAILDDLGGIDVLINNAGIGKFGRLGEVTAADFLSVFNVNVIGLTLLTQVFLPTFQKQGSGNIVNIASTAALKGFAGGSVYSASKFALRSLTQCWQAELRKSNIRVIGVNPSEVPTAFGQADRTERPEQDGKLTPQEIADAIVGALKIDERGFIPELSVWATNPF